MAQALIIKPTGEVEPVTIPDTDSYRVLNELCEGLLDCVYTDELVGYVNDEGLLIGLAPNALASLIFNRPIVGNVVLVGALNDEGECDGENHDIPEQYDPATLSLLSHALVSDEDIMDSLRGAIADIDLVPRVSVLTDEQFEAWLNGDFSGYTDEQLGE